MKKIVVIFGSILFFSLILALIFWMGEDEKLAKIAEGFEKSQKAEVKSDEISKNLTGLLTVKQENFPKYNNRMVIGETLKPLNKIPEKIELLNTVDPNWDKKTISYLNDSSDYDRKISIIKKGSLIGLNNQSGINLEQATISFTQRDGSRGSFEALINSENGSIEMVISKNINENVEEPSPAYKATDSANNPFANNASPEEVKELNEGNVESILENLNQERLADFNADDYEEELKMEEAKL
ncbi:MAG: hypothetical protein ACHQYQ_07795, partial [Bacteriovoracales bacterium]